MPKYWKYPVCGAVFAAFLTGCATAPEPEKSPDPEIAAIGDASIADSVRMGRESGEILLKALAENQFALAKDLPVGSAKDTLTAEKFNSLQEKVIAPNGGIAAHSYLGDLARGNYRRMLWKVTFRTPKKELQGVDFLFEVWVGRLDGQLRIVGFQFHP